MDETRFSGAVFDGSRGPQRIAATIEVAGDAVLARGQGGEEWRLALTAESISRGGASGKMIFVRGFVPSGEPLTICCEGKGFEQALQLAIGAGGNAELAQWSQADRKRRSRGRAGCLVLLAILVAGLLALPTLWRLAVDASIEAVPPAVDEKIGEFAWEQMSGSLELIEVPALDAAFTVMQERLWPAFGEQPWELQIFVADEGQINAFALPGGTMVFHSGLIFAAEKPEEVAAVLAHEIAHITHRHSLHGMADSLGIIAVAQIFLGDVSGLVVIAKEVLTMAALNSRSQAAEAEADRTAAIVLYKSGIDPRHLGTFFQRLRDRYGDAPEALYWMSSHPSHGDRIAAVEALAVELEADFGPLQEQSLDINWEKVQSALAESGAAGENATVPTAAPPKENADGH